MQNLKIQNILIQKGFSNREAEISSLVSAGLTDKEIANQLFIASKTVRFHLTNIYRRLNIKSRAQLIVYCMPFTYQLESTDKKVL